MRSVVRFTLCTVGALAWLLVASTVRAQSGTSSISGRVTDAQGAVVPGATVTLTNVATTAPRTTNTNESGLYRMTAVLPGTYN